MTYTDAATLSTDADFRARIAACVATQGDQGVHPTAWADANQWQIAASPGFADAYAYAVNSDVPRPGKDVSVITDEQLLAAVQARIAALTPPEADETT